MNEFIKKQVYSDTLAGTSAITITPAKGFKSFRVRNVSSDYGQNLLVSLDDTDYHEVPQNADLDFPLHGDILYVKTDTAGAKYNIIMDEFV